MSVIDDPSRTSVLVMPGRGTLARRNGRTGPDGVIDDEPERAFRRATTRVPRKARLAHAAAVGTIGIGSCAQASLEAALSRARTTSGWALTLGRARILRAAPATPGQLAERCGRLRAPGQRRHPGCVTVCNCARDAELSDAGRDPGRRRRCGRVCRRPPGDRGIRNIPVAKPKASRVPVGHHSPPGACRSKPVTTGIGGGSSGSNSLAGVGRASTGRSTSTAAAAWRRSNSNGDT